MNAATGIHITNRALRLVNMALTDGAPSVIGLTEVAFSTPVIPGNFSQDAANSQLQAAIEQIAPACPQDETPVGVCLPGGCYHIQKVPLEVASTEDRREQITWEAAQALTGDIDAYDIDFLPAGRSAFWVAIRKEIREALGERFGAHGITPTAFTVEPLSLFHTLAIRPSAPHARQAIIHWHAPWLTFAAIEHGMPIAAEAIHAGDENEAPRQLWIDQYIRQRVLGDLDADNRQIAFNQVHICGAPEDMQILRKSLSGLEIIEVSATDDDRVAGTGTPSSVFAIAAGTALTHLVQR